MEATNRYSLRQAAPMLGIKVRTLRAWIKTGKIQAQKYEVSNRWFIPQGEIERLTGHDNED